MHKWSFSTIMSLNNVHSSENAEFGQSIETTRKTLCIRWRSSEQQSGSPFNISSDQKEIIIQAYTKNIDKAFWFNSRRSVWVPIYSDPEQQKAQLCSEPKTVDLSSNMNRFLFGCWRDPRTESRLQISSITSWMCAACSHKSYTHFWKLHVISNHSDQLCEYLNRNEKSLWTFS